MIEPIICSVSNAYLINNNDRNILIDTGMIWDGKTILNFLHKRIERLDLIYLTHAHPDHYGSCKMIQEITGAPIAIHQEDLALLQSGKIFLGKPRGIGRLMKLIAWFFNQLPHWDPPEPDLLLEDSDHLLSIGIEAEVIHTPGHTAGSSSLLFSDGSIFVGDLASSSRNPHIQKYFVQDWSILVESVHKIIKKEPRIIYPGHGQKAISGSLLINMIKTFTTT